MHTEVKTDLFDKVLAVVLAGMVIFFASLSLCMNMGWQECLIGVYVGLVMVIGGWVFGLEFIGENKDREGERSEIPPQ